MMMYKLTDEDIIICIDNGSFIPKSEKNTDYQKYLEWIAEGNEPEPVHTQAELEQEAIYSNNAAIKAELLDADLKAIRALIEDDKARIAQINQAQKDRRKKLIPPG